MESYVLINTDDNSYDQLDWCHAKSITEAQTEFSMRGWVVGTVMTAWDYHGTLHDEYYGTFHDDYNHDFIKGA